MRENGNGLWEWEEQVSVAGREGAYDGNNMMDGRVPMCVCVCVWWWWGKGGG
jgi:hypothetical protein